MARPKAHIDEDRLYCDQGDWHIELDEAFQSDYTGVTLIRPEEMTDAINSFVDHIIEFHEIEDMEGVDWYA